MSVPTILNPYTGKSEGRDVGMILSPRGIPIAHEENYKRGWRKGGPDFNRLPQDILDLLEKSAGRAGPFAGMDLPRADSNDYERLRYSISVDGSAITAAAEAIMVPAFNFGNSEMDRPGKSIAYTLAGRLSQAVTTPGTAIFRMRWGGAAGALCATSNTIAPTGTQVVTNVGFILQYWMTVRTLGSAGTLFCQGNWECPGTLETTPASTTILVTHLKDRMIPSSAPAVSAAIDFTASLGPTPTYQPSVATASLTVHQAWLELLN